MEQLFGKTLDELIGIVKEARLPAFTARQIAEWLYSHQVSEIEEMTNLSKKARAWLESLKREGKFLVVIPSGEEFDAVRKSFRNLPMVTILSPERLNTIELLKNDTIISHESAFETVRATWQV